MARHESDREDLLREATALVERAELQVAPWQEPIVVGFRRDGSLSVFFGAEPVYQFNSRCELRRAYAGGLLYKAEHGELVALRRERTESRTELVRTKLGREESLAFLGEMQEALQRLRHALERADDQVVGQVPADGDVPRRVLAWLDALPTAISIAAVPNAR